MIKAPTGLMHGKSSMVFHEGSGIFQSIQSPLEAARYHSLVVGRQGFPLEHLSVTAWTEDGTIMGLQHKHCPHLVGVQFHPESIMTEEGMRIVGNFLRLVGQAEGNAC